MLTLQIDLIDESNINTLDDLIKLFINFKHVYNYVSIIKPSIPMSSMRQQNFYNFTLTHNGYIGLISSLQSKIPPHKMTIINDINRVFKLNHLIVPSEKYNLVLTSSDHIQHDTQIVNPLIFYYTSTLTHNFKNSFESKFYVQHSSPPQDQQTLLELTSRYRYIKKICNIHGDRKIYKSMTDSIYYYIDDFHVGESAQIEVFDSSGNHLGEASIYDDSILPNTADSSKKCKTIK